MSSNKLRNYYLEKLSTFEFFDCNLWIPDPMDMVFSPKMNLNEVLLQAQKANIKSAVVSTASGYRQDPIYANSALLDAVREDKNLFAGATLAPEITLGKNDPEEYIHYLVSNKTVLVRLFPKRQNYSMQDWCMGRIFAELESKQLPLYIWHTETSFDQVAGICSRYKNLPVVIAGNDQKLLYHNRSYIPLMKAFPNVYIETHNFVQYLAYEFFHSENLTDRLVFGSNMPLNEPGVAVAALLFADIPDSVRRQIAYTNLYDLINRIRC